MTTSLRIALALALAGCGVSSAPPESAPAQPSRPEPAGPPPLALRDCGPPPPPLQPELARLSIARPASPAALELSLPPGITLRPASPVAVGAWGAVEPISALARDDLEVCCEPGFDPTGFSSGCQDQFRCVYRDGEGRRARTPTELAAMLAPIDTPARALGIVSLLHREVLAEPETAMRSAERFDLAALPDRPPAFEIVPAGDGFVVRAAVMDPCGCSQPIVRVAFRVGRDGCVERADEPLVPLAHSAAERCVVE